MDGEEITVPLNNNGYEYVDLGLPSGTLWAKYNIGAETEEQAGLYFAWGETSGYTPEQVTGTTKEREFTWNSYKWSIEGSSTNFSKYNSTDNKTVLDLEDDAAHIILGGDWKIPSKEDFEELTANTTYDSDTINGIQGMKFISKTNENYVFFPFAGYIGGNSMGYRTYTYCWSSTINIDKISNSTTLICDEKNISVGVGMRCYACNLRSVLKH